MRFKWLKVLLVTLIATALLAGCATQKAPEQQQQKQLNFGMVIKEPGAPFVQAFVKGAEGKAQELGVKVDIKDGQADSMKIMEIMDTFITQKVDGFIMAGAVDLKAIVPGI